MHIFLMKIGNGLKIGHSIIFDVYLAVSENMNTKERNQMIENAEKTATLILEKINQKEFF